MVFKHTINKPIIADIYLSFSSDTYSKENAEKTTINISTSFYQYFMYLFQMTNIQKAVYVSEAAGGKNNFLS